MRGFKLLASVFIIIFTAFPAIGDHIKIGTKHHIQSQILSEDREYWISLPPSYTYNSYTNYPVLYLLDADFNYFFQTFSGMVNQMASDASPKIPEMIVVGVLSQQRVRDSSPTKSLIQYGGKPNKALEITGGAGQFIDFFAKELVPHIGREYRTSDYKILTGYSFTGLPVLQALFEAPNTFNAYIAIDPSLWWDNQVMLKNAEAFLKGQNMDGPLKQNLNKRQLFIATSKRVAKVYPKENYVIDFINLLNKTPKQGLVFNAHIYGLEENHHTMPIPAFYKGLSTLFEGYMMDEETRFRSATEVKNHFERMSEKLGTILKPQEGLINYFGSDRLYNDQFDINAEVAISFFELNTHYYPGSFNAWQNLAYAYKKIGAPQKALAAFKKALQLDPSHQKTAQQIEELQTR